MPAEPDDRTIPRMRPRLLPRPSGFEIQEWAYLLLYVFYMALLAGNGLAGTGAFWEMAGLLAGGLAAVSYGQNSPALAAKRVRWFYFMAAMGVCYQALGKGVPEFRANGAVWLRGADSWLTGGQGDAWLETLSHPVLTELMAWCYMGFFPFLYLGLWRHGWLPGARAGAFFQRLGLLYALGFLGYILCPAAGPYLDFPSEALPPPGWRGAEWNAAMVAWGSNRVDCFPSLHCAVSGLILIFDAKVSRRVFWCHLPLVAGIWCSTVYLRQHYFVDMLGGLALLGLALGMARSGLPGGASGRKDY